MVAWWPATLIFTGCGPDRHGQPPPQVAAECDATVAAPPPQQLRLLTRREYNRTVADLLPHVAGSAGAACAVDADCAIGSESCVGGACQLDPCEVVTFQLAAAPGEHDTVSVAGTFNGWDPTAWPLTWVPEHGAWVGKQVVADGEHAYKLVADGAWLPDAANPSTADDGYGGVNSILLQDCAGTAAAGASFDPAADFPVESRPTHYPFDNAAESGLVTTVHVEQYAAAAETLAEAAAADLSALVSCQETDPACAATFVADLGERAFRRPLTGEEIDRYAALVTTQEDWRTGVEAAVQAMLQSPYFLYRSEIGVPDGDAHRLDGYEIASALSYLIVGSMPDEALLAAAEQGALDTPAGREAEARRLLAEPRAREQMADFAVQWLGVEQVAGLVRSDPEFDAELGAAMVDETRAFFTWVMFDGPRRYSDLLLSQTTFVDERLADLYGVSGTGEVALPAERVGLLGKASVLAATSHSDQSSPIRRGLTVRERLLCQTFPTPPANVGPVPEVDPNATTRERFAQHTQDDFCAACHEYIDPIGFGLEQFDEIGAFRTDENGLPIDASGVLLGLEDLAADDEVHPFDGLGDLAGILAGSESARRCFTTQVWRFSTGRLEQDSDACAIAAADDWLAQADGDLQEALVAIVASEDFVRRSAP